MGIQFSNEQTEAITARNCDLLVSAAAGSGKTAVLVERIIRLITDSQNPVDIDHLLVVTFTEAAAFEMRQRISDALALKITQTDGEEIQHFQKQALLLHKASITTIHAFCLSVMRQNFHLLDIDPGFAVAEQSEIKLIKSQTISELFENEYSKEENFQFFELVEIFGSKLNDNGLQNLVLETFNFINALPNPEVWLSEQIKKFNLDEPDWLDIIKEEIQMGLDTALWHCNKAQELASSPDAPKGYYDVILTDRQLVTDLILSLNKGLSEFYQEITNISFKRLPPSKGLNPIKEEISEIRDNIKGIISDYKNKVFMKSPELMLRDLKKIYPIMKTFADLVISFKNAYTKAKQERNLVDFNDLEHYCLQILCCDNQPTAVAYEYREYFKEILIDEYQDSNPIQEAILSLIAKDSRFMVGDIKQSIYKFRLAKPELFIEKYLQYSYDKNSRYRKIDLSQNYRSRAVVLDFINYIFKQLMTVEFGKIEYDAQAQLYYGADYPINDDKPVEVLLIDRTTTETEDDTEDIIMELSAAQLEARAVANHINKMVDANNPQKVYDRATQSYRAAKFSDIVIILRSLQEQAAVFDEELKNANIPAYVSTQGGYFSSIEVMTMLSILQIIDNPRQDIHLICVLFSPIYKITPDQLISIREHKLKSSYYESILAYLSNNENEDELRLKLHKFINNLNHWREISKYTPISQLIFEIYTSTSFYEYVGAMTIGTLRQRNLRALTEMAARFEKTSYKGLFNFVSYIEKLQKSGTEAGDTTEQTENVVRILTIHKSKGLEFPIVYVSMLGKQFNKQDQKRKLLMHQDYGFGLMYTDTEKRLKSNTLSRMALQRQIHKENYYEELRCLYVALTRAKEILILTGSTKKLDKKLQYWQQFQNEDKLEIPTYYLLKATSFLDWIMPTLLRHKSQNSGKLDISCKFTLEFVKENTITTEKENPIIAKTNQPSVAEMAEINTEELNKLFSWEYPFYLETTIPVKVSISEIKRINQKLIAPDAIEYFSALKQNHKLIRNHSLKYRIKCKRKKLPLPSFMKENLTPSAAEIGTALHTVVEHMDLFEHNSPSKIKNLIDFLVDKQIINKDVAPAIPIRSLYDFTRTDLADRMRNALYIKRETPFVLGKTPEEIYKRPPYNKTKGLILVHGIIDCFFAEEDGIVLVDYKSDYVGNSRHINRLKEKYRIQLDIYKEAIERSTGEKVKETVLFLFSTNTTLNM